MTTVRQRAWFASIAFLATVACDLAVGAAAGPSILIAGVVILIAFGIAEGIRWLEP